MTKLKPTRSMSRRHGSLSLTNNYTRDPWAGPILKALLNNKDSTYWQNFMKGFTETTHVVRHWHIRPIPKVTIGRPYGQMPSPTLKNVIAASDKLPCQNFWPKI